MVDLAKFTPTERRILTYVVAHPTATKTMIAEGLHLTRSHVSRLMNSEKLRLSLEALQLDQLAEATRVSNAAATDAVTVLASIVNDASASNSDRIKAAKVLLDFRLQDTPEKPERACRYIVTIDRDGLIHQEKRFDEPAV